MSEVVSKTVEYTDPAGQKVTEVTSSRDFSYLDRDYHRSDALKYALDFYGTHTEDGTSFGAYLNADVEDVLIAAEKFVQFLQG